MIRQPWASAGLRSWARWSLTPLGSKENPPSFPLNNARADKLSAWPWRAVQRHRCLIPASGFWEPEKLAREKGVAPWSYYSMTDGRPFFMAGLWAEAADHATGEVADTYTLIITDANATMRVHDRMPADLATQGARRWIEPGPLPVELLAPDPAEEITAWRVADDAKNSRIEPQPGMAEPAAVDHREAADPTPPAAIPPRAAPAGESRSPRGPPPVSARERRNAHGDVTPETKRRGSDLPRRRKSRLSPLHQGVNVALDLTR